MWARVVQGATVISRPLHHVDGGYFKYSLNEAKSIWGYGPSNVAAHIIEVTKKKKTAKS